MTIFIYGEDKFLARQKLNEIKNNFIKTDKSGLNFIYFSDNNLDWLKIQQAVSTSTFFSDKKMVVIENIISKAKKDLQEKIVDLLDKKNISKDFIVIFFENGKIDSRKKIFKKLLKSDQVLVFNQLNYSQVNLWIENEVKKRNGLIDKMAINKLASFVGPDLFRLNKEIDKLIAYTVVGEGGKRQISVSDIDLLVGANIDENIFNFTESLSRKDKKNALKLFHEQFVFDSDFNYFLSMIVFQFRNMIRVKDLASKNFNQYQIAKMAKIHPYAVLKSLDVVKNFEIADLKNIYDQLFRIERDLKNGEGDIMLKMDKFIVEL
ncbi:MAG: DNA polymerase III subunit delta [Patescibacteria group bacterium]|jgi:DNA polymerase-3 subunit delta